MPRMRTYTTYTVGCSNWRAGASGQNGTIYDRVRRVSAHARLRFNSQVLPAHASG